MGMKGSCNLRFYSDICLEGLNEVTKKPHDRKSPGRDLNPEPLECEAGVLSS
jgi:hypothetical protein